MSDPFPSPYSTIPGDDPLLGLALTTAAAEVAVMFPGVPLPAISIVAVHGAAPDLDCRHAGISFGDVYFSGSLPKVVAMYAAFELRRAVNMDPAITGAGNAAAAQAAMRAQFNPLISGASAIISANGQVTPDMKVPKYDQIFATIPTDTGQLFFEFNLQFSTLMRKMIVESDNGAAGACVKALGYSWINGVAERGGFFFTPSQTGVWLAGTYGGGWPAVRVPSVNDGPTAQGMTCFDTANMYAHLLQGDLGAPFLDSSPKMLELLSAAANFDFSFIDWERRNDVSPKKYRVTHTKIGIGPTTSGNLLSEATILHHLDTGNQFIVVLQNIRDAGNTTEAAATLVNLTIEHYLFGA